MSKIVSMVRSVIGELGRIACVCAVIWSGTSSLSLADADPSVAPVGSGLGLGGAYLFGLIAGLAMFGVRYALDVRKSHLAVYGK